jgi:membrane protein YqaA with SNARE-associated domain
VTLPHTPRGIAAVSLGWGFSEAIFFFLVPDIWLSRIAITDLRKAIFQALIAAAGAIVGGIILYWLGLACFTALTDWLDTIPGISPDMIASVGHQATSLSMPAALAQGMLTGTPFKLYAAWFGHLHAYLPHFIFFGFLLRTARFVAVIALSYVIASVLAKHIPLPRLLQAHAAAWCVFYIAYFVHFGF